VFLSAFPLVQNNTTGSIHDDPNGSLSLSFTHPIHFFLFLSFFI